MPTAEVQHSATIYVIAEALSQAYICCLIMHVHSHPFNMEYYPNESPLMSFERKWRYIYVSIIYNMMPVHVEVQYYLFYQTLLFIADCWPIRIAIIIIISVRILCGHMYVSLL